MPDITDATDTAATSVAATSVPAELTTEIEQFQVLCCRRYRFNSNLDNLLTSLGIIVSLGVIACGVYKRSDIAALLGGAVTTIVAAQRAFPFTQRWQFYRILDGQTSNLLTDIRSGQIDTAHAVLTLKSMRLDFAQQVPRGTNTQTGSQAGSQTVPAADNTPKAG